MPHTIRDESCYMAPLQLAGRLIMENGGETYRVEETITRMGQALGLEGVESFAVPSGVFVTYRRSDGAYETAVIRVRKASTNLARVDEVNDVSRRLEAGEVTFEEVCALLQAIADAPPPNSKLMVMLATTVSSGGFTVMFGGGVIEFAVAAFSALAAQLLTVLMQRRRLQGLVTVLAGAVTSAFLPMLFNYLTGLCVVDATVAGALMPLLPGLAMTIAVQDTLRGDMVSGISHGFSAALTAVMVAGGALLAASLMSIVRGGAAL